MLTVATAQERFGEIVRGHLAPALRSMGFKGSGQEFILPDERDWIMIGIQRSGFSDRNDLLFTVQLTVVSKQEWAELCAEHTGQPGYRARPYPTRFYGRGVWQTRLSQLLPTPEDKWWRVTADTDASTLAAEVVQVLTAYGLPAIATRTGPPS